MGENASLWTLFVSSFLAATLLPGGSEAVLFAVLKVHNTLLWPALTVATFGNTLGGLSSYVVGRIIPQLDAPQGTRAARWQSRALAWARTYGAPVMLAAWAPLIGDPLCVAAGWLRLSWIPVTVFMALGKLARYSAIAWTAL
jgi:membrane protein YqaA with SNARE-associated domain